MARVLPLLIAQFLAASLSPVRLAGGSETSKVITPTFPSQEAPLAPITPALENQIVDAFAAGRCDVATGLVRPGQYDQLKPLILAVIAYCEPTGQDPEALFERAERLSPSHDTIVVLHARHRWKKDPESSIALWQRVLLLARSVTTRAMAREYIEGTAEGDENIAIGGTLTYFGSAQVGAGYETNPLGSSTQGLDNAPGSAAQNTQLLAGLRQLTDFGSLATNLGLNYNNYFSLHEADFLEADFDAPIALRAGANEDIAFRPFGSYSTLGASPYQALLGIGVVGVAYRQNYKQSVQGSVFQDRYFPGDFQAQQGTHFRFDYDWELYSGSDYFRMGFYFEHVTASADEDLTGTLSIPYSHNEMGAQFGLDLKFKWCILSLYPRFSFRLDDDPSTYYPSSYDPSSGLPPPPVVSKTRYDYQLALRPAVTFPLAGYLQLIVWYEWNRTYSNITADDYVDRRYLDQTVGIALRGLIANIY